MSKKNKYYSSESDTSFTATSESSQFSQSNDDDSSYQTTDESSVSMETPMSYASNFLSNPANQLSCNKDESGEMSKEAHHAVSDNASSALSSSSEEEEELPTVFLKAPNLVHISTKMTNTTEMGELVPVSGEATTAAFKLESVDTLSKKEYEAIAMKQSRRVADDGVRTKSNLVPWHSLSTKEQESFKLKYDARQQLGATYSKPIATVTKDLYTVDELVPWDSLSAKEQETMTLKHEARLNAFHQTSTAAPIKKDKAMGELIPWMSLSAKEQEVITLKHETRKMALASIVSSSANTTTKKAVSLSSTADLSQSEVAILMKKQVERPSKGINAYAMGECEDAADKASGYPCDSKMKTFARDRCEGDEKYLTGFACDEDPPVFDRKHMDVLADIDDLSPEEMRAILKKREKHHHHHHHHDHKHRPHHHQAMPEISITARPMVSSEPMKSNALTTKQYRQTSQLANIDSMDTQKLDNLFAPYSNNASVERELVNFNTLSSEKQASILRNMETHSFANQSATSLSEKRVFESLNASKLMSVGASKLFLGMPLTTAVETSNVACPKNKLPDDGICGDKMMAHIKKAFPMYAEMIARTGMQDMLSELVHNHDIHYLIIVPNSAILDAFRGQSTQKMMTMLASLMLLMHKGEMIPASKSMYSCMTPLDGVRTMVRRKNASTLEIENASEATLDPNSKGRIYRMAEQPTIEDLGDEEEEEGEIEINIDAEEDEEEAEPSTTTTTTTTTTTKGKKEKPRVQLEIMETMPTNDSDDLSLIAIDEENMEVPSRELVLTAVHHTYAYKNRNIETLCQKMMSPSYNGKSDMANFVDYGSNSATKSLGTKKDEKKKMDRSEEKLYLKIYSFEELYKKYELNTLHPSDTEKLSLSGAYEISTYAPITYNLDKSLSMRESIMPANLRIKKSELINHVCVLSAKNAQNAEYSVALFSMPNTNIKSDVFMSSDESVVMRFQNNVLSSIALNSDASKFPSIRAAPQLEEKSSVMALRSRRHRGRHGMHSAIVSQLSMGVKFDEASFARLYVKDMKFDAFVGAVLPLSVPSFIKKAEALGRHLFSKVHTLVASEKEMRLSTYETKAKKDEMAEILIGIGGGSRDLANNLHTYFFLRKQWEQRDGGFERIYEYQYIDEGNRYNDSRGYGRVDFRKMQGLRASKTLSITMKNPFTGKSQNFLFKLRNPLGIEKVTRYETAKSDPIDKNTHAFFVLEKGLLTKFYLSYPAPNRRYGVQKTLGVPRKSGGSRFEKSIATFLSDEANAYARFNTDIANMSYLGQRLSSFASRSASLSVAYDKAKSLAFFQSLSSEVKGYLDKLASPVTQKKITTSVILSPEAQQKMIETSYLIPNESETQRYHTLLTSGFKTHKPGAALATMLNASSSSTKTEREYNTKSVLQSIVAHYGASKEESLFHQYMTRVHFIINSLVATLQK